MAEIIKIRSKEGEVQYPVTKPEAVIDENGNDVITLIDNAISAAITTTLNTEV
jgi:hypothetical protein